MGPALSDPKFQSDSTDQEIFDTINKGHKSTPMIAWGDVLTSDQIQQLVDFIRQLRQESSQTPAGPVYYAKDVAPIFKDKCRACHGSLGGWDAKSYAAAAKKYVSMGYKYIRPRWARAYIDARDSRGASKGS